MKIAFIDLSDIQYQLDSVDSAPLGGSQSAMILVGEELAGCVAFRRRPDEIRIDSFYLARRHHNSGLGTAILKVLLAEADALRLPIRLEVLTGSKADRFYLRHGFVKLREDSIEGEYERPVPKRLAAIKAAGGVGRHPAADARSRDLPRRPPGKRRLLRDADITPPPR